MSWDEAAATWDTDPAVRAYAEGAWGSLQAFLEQQQRSLTGAQVLDFGAGTGLLSTRLADAGATVVALDLSPAMIASLARKAHPRVQPVAGTLADVDGTFNLIVASSVCAFVDDYPATVRDLTRRLVPGGWFVQWDWERDPHAEDPYGLDRVTIEGALMGAGLHDVMVSEGFVVTFEGHRMAPLRGVGRR